MVSKRLDSSLLKETADELPVVYAIGIPTPIAAFFVQVPSSVDLNMSYSFKSKNNSLILFAP